MPTPLTTEFIGSRADVADAVTDYTATKIAGGGQSPSVAVATLFKQGSAAIATDYPTASRFVTLHFDDTVQSWDFSSGGAEEDQLVWVWGNALLAPTSTGTAAGGALGGFGIVMTDNAPASIDSSWAIWTFYGGENYPGGWQKMVVDPSLRPTASGGTFALSSLASIRGIGVFFVADNNAKGGADAALIDAIDIGSGLRIYGSGTQEDGFGDLLAADAGTDANQYGVVKSLEATDTILQLQGYLEIGTGNLGGTVFDDINKVISFNNPQYIDTFGVTQYVNAIPDTFQQINIVGNTTSGTEVELGIKVGDGDTARGRNGLTFLGNDDYKISLIVEDEPNVQLQLYGTSIRSFNEAITWPAESGHEFIGSTIDGSAQFVGDTGIVIRNSTFQNATGIEGSFIWNHTGIDIKNSNFVANTNVDGSGAGIEHPFSGTFTYDNLQFSNNDFDINFSLATSGDLVIQATNLSNPATAHSGNVDSTVTIENSVTLTLTDIVVGSEVRLFNSNTTNQVAGVESEGDGTFEHTYNFTGNQNIDIVVHHLDYKYFRSEENLLTSAAASIRIDQIFDRNYDNP